MTAKAIVTANINRYISLVDVDSFIAGNMEQHMEQGEQPNRQQSCKIYHNIGFKLNRLQILDFE